MKSLLSITRGRLTIRCTYFSSGISEVLKRLVRLGYAKYHVQTVAFCLNIIISGSFLSTFTSGRFYS